MLNYSKKKKNKINTYKAVRENILLNKNNIANNQCNNISYESLIFQLAEINLTNHLNNHKSGLSGKIIVKWWEN